ncbi:MAG: PD-(D/E)XK motif protein [Candidatus Omnitrophota bacterium]|jgi:type III secretory pathway component EscS
MRTKSSLLSIFAILPIPKTTKGGESFSAQAIERSPHQIGKDTEGRPAILIATGDEKKRGIESPCPVALEHISVRYNVLCEISKVGEVSRQGRFIVIRCESHDNDLVEYFLRTMEVHISSLGVAPSYKQVIDMVGKLIELFRALTQVSKQSIQGLWAELLVIAESSDPHLLLRSWHFSPDDRYDFAFEQKYIEIKSTSGAARIHHFSLEQLNPPSGTSAIIVSLFVERSLNGLTVIDLMDRIQAEIRGDVSLLAHLHRNVTLILASDWRQADSLKFDQHLAKKSLRIYDVGSVPSVSCPVPLEISEVKFKANLSRTKPLDPTSLEVLDGLFAAITKIAVTTQSAV